jgi:citronellol/citronellal dehydrogenase
VINNASAAGFGDLSLKRYDLMQDINVRGTFALSSAALPHLLASSSPRVLTLSPPLNLKAHWFSEHAPYTVSKYGMTMLTLGLAEQFRDQGIAATCLWPQTFISTAAVANVLSPDDTSRIRTSRRPEIMADAAVLVLTSDPKDVNGRCLIDEVVLRECGVTDLSEYLNDGGAEDSLRPDLFL